MLTPDEYVRITGDGAPEDFCACLALAHELIDAHTLYAYVGRDMESLPSGIASRYKRALALQTQAISMRGGVAGMHDMQINSASLGHFSYTVNNSGNAEGTSSSELSAGVSSLMPVLIAYGRGLRSCCRSR